MTTPRGRTAVPRRSTSRAPRARTSATRWPRPARRSRPVGGAHRLQPRPDPLPRGRGARVPARSARPPSPAHGGRRGGRRARALRRLDRQVPGRARRDQPGGRAVSVLLVPRADRQWSAWSLPTSPALLGLVAEVAPRWRPATRWWRSSRSQPLAGLDLAEVLGCPTSPAGVVNLLSGRRTELATALGAPPRPQRDRRRRRRSRAGGRARPPGRRDDQARPPRRRGGQLRDGGRRCAGAHRGAHRAEDGLASGRGVVPVRSVTRRPRPLSTPSSVRMRRRIASDPA